MDLSIAIVREWQMSASVPVPIQRKLTKDYVCIRVPVPANKICQIFISQLCYLLFRKKAHAVTVGIKNTSRLDLVLSVVLYIQVNGFDGDTRAFGPDLFTCCSFSGSAVWEDDQPCTFVLPDSWCRLCVITIIRWQITWLDLGVGEPPQGMFARPCQVELVCFRRLRLKGVVGVRVNRVGGLLDYKSMSTICANLWLRGLCQDSLLLSRWLLLRNNR